MALAVGKPTHHEKPALAVVLQGVFSDYCPVRSRRQNVSGEI